MAETDRAGQTVDPRAVRSGGSEQIPPLGRRRDPSLVAGDPLEGRRVAGVHISIRIEEAVPPLQVVLRCVAGDLPLDHGLGRPGLFGPVQLAHLVEKLLAQVPEVSWWS